MFYTYKCTDLCALGNQDNAKFKPQVGPSVKRIFFPQ